MKINITRNIEGAKQAEGLVVVIDVFRAFSTAYYLFHNGADGIIPFEDNAFGFRMRQANPSYLLIGENMGVKIDRFDYSNSPSEIKDVDFSGKTVMLKTTRGTRGLLSLDHDKVTDVIVGSLVGLSAIISYIKSKNPDVVTLVCMDEPQKQAYEDEVCALSIKEGLEERVLDHKGIYQRIRRSDAARRFFDPDVKDTPEEDFDLCMQCGKFDFVIKYDLDKRSLYVHKL